MDCLSGGLDTDELEYHLIGVVAGIGSTQVNLKKLSSDSFGQVIWYQITNYTGTKYGFSATVYFDVDSGDVGSTLTVECGVVSVSSPITVSVTASIAAGVVKLLSSAAITCSSVVTASLRKYKRLTAQSDCSSTVSGTIFAQKPGLYFFGGATSQVYSTVQDAWADRSIPTGDHERGAFGVISGLAQLGMGVNNTNCDRYNHATNAASANTAGTARDGCSGAVVASKLYALHGIESATVKDTCLEYEPGGDAWATKTAGGNARYRHAAFFDSGSIYKTCGTTSAALTSQTTNAYSQGGDSWSTLTAAPTPSRTQSCFFTISGVGYSAIGVNSLGNIIADLDAYTISGDSWAAKTDFPDAPASSTWCGGQSLDVGYVMGSGSGNSRSYSTGGDSWATISLPSATVRQASATSLGQ